jgi:hypothetical protein
MRFRPWEQREEWDDITEVWPSADNVCQHADVAVLMQLVLTVAIYRAGLYCVSSRKHYEK